MLHCASQRGRQCLDQRSSSVEPFAPTRDFKSPSRDVHDNFEPMRCDPAVSPHRIVDPPCDCWGATAPADCREARQDLWSRVVRAQIEAIRYTFNVQSAGRDLSRSWIWEPKTDELTYEGKDKSDKPVEVTYLRSQLGSQSAEVKETIDPDFLNDNY